MRPSLRNIIIIVLLVAIVVTFHIVRRNSTMRGVEVNVKTPSKSVLLDENDIDSLLLAEFPSLKQTDIKDVDRKAIAKKLKENPYVLDAAVRMTTGGKLVVDIEQRVPVVRMFYQNNEFYISRQGTCMPLAPRHYCHLLVGSTAQEEPLLKRPSRLDLADTSNHRQPTSLMKIWKLASFLSDNPKYGAIFDQVYVGDKGDLFLVPKLGELTVNVGDTSILDTKFRNLWSFFDQGISQVGWDTYSAISLKYKGQVVGTKKK